MRHPIFALFSLGLSLVMPGTSFADLPLKFDLRESLGLTPIKNQGACGSAWAFITTAAMETAIKRAQGKEVNLSEDFLMQCAPDPVPCGGGTADFFTMAVDPGVVLAEDFTGSCQSAPIFAKAKAAVPVSTDAAIKQATFDYGTVATTVYASSAFLSYSGGIFNQCDNTGGVNHVVQIVGWDDEAKNWIVRGSWGPQWGENGYMRIQYGCNQIGSEAAYLSY
jgi:C1A family cysteine protease